MKGHPFVPLVYSQLDVEELNTPGGITEQVSICRRTGL